MAVAIPRCQLEHFWHSEKVPKPFSCRKFDLQKHPQGTEIKAWPATSGTEEPKRFVRYTFWGVPNHPRMICMNLYVFYMVIQWQFQDPKMEVLYHIRPYFVVIFTYIGLKNRPYIWNRYLQLRNLKWSVMVCSFHVLPWFARPCWMVPAYLSTFEDGHFLIFGLEAHHLRSICSFDQFCPGVIIRNCRLGWREKKHGLETCGTPFFDANKHLKTVVLLGGSWGFSWFIGRLTKQNTKVFVQKWHLPVHPRKIVITCGVDTRLKPPPKNDATQ